MHLLFSSPGCPPPINEAILIYFVSHCATQLNLQYSTIKGYLCGIRNYYIESGLGNPLQNSHGQALLQLQLTLRGIRKVQISSQRPRLPITADILSQLCGLFHSGLYGPFIDTLMSAVCTTAFFGFLRCGEFTSNGHFNPHIGLALSDLSFKPDLQSATEVSLRIKVSKTDPFRESCTIQLYCTNVPLCPVCSLVRYAKMCSNSTQRHAQSPFFMLPNGAALTRSDFITRMRHALHVLGFPSHMYAGHSFRIGAATSAARAQLPDHIIRTLGRWSSDCYIRYIRSSKQTISSALERLARLV